MKSIFDVEDIKEGSLNRVFGNLDTDGNMELCRNELAAGMRVECNF